MTENNCYKLSLLFLVVWNNLYNNLLWIETLELHEFPVQLPPSEGSDGTDEEMVTDEEIGDGFSLT